MWIGICVYVRAYVFGAIFVWHCGPVVGQVPPVPPPPAALAGRRWHWVPRTGAAPTHAFRLPCVAGWAMSCLGFWQNSVQVFRGDLTYSWQCCVLCCHYFALIPKFVVRCCTLYIFIKIDVCGQIYQKWCRCQMYKNWCKIMYAPEPVLERCLGLLMDRDFSRDLNCHCFLKVYVS